MKTLESLCHNDSFLKTKVALMTFYNTKYPQWFEKVLLIVEYLQLVSQGLFLHLSTAEYQSEANRIYFEIIYYFFKLINPSYLFSWTHHNAALSSILVILFALTMLKYLLAVYVVCIAFWKGPRDNFQIYIWRFVFKLQSRVLCFLTTSFWVQTIVTYSTGEFSLYGMSKSVAIAICAILLIIEYMFSFYFEIKLCYVLPNKSFLSSKSFGMQITTLTQKLLLQIFQLALYSQPLNFWAYSTINLIFSSIKQYAYYQALPLYKLKCLLIQADLLGLVTSLNLACFVQSFLVQVDYQTNQVNTVIVLWIIFAFFMKKGYSQLMIQKIINLMTEKTECPPSVFIHKIIISKQLRKNLQLPTKYSEKYDITYLLGAREEFHMEYGFSLDPNQTREDIDSKMDIDEVYLRSLEHIQSRFPEDEFIKVYLAHFCSKSPRLCFKAIKILGELKHRPWSTNHLSSLLLLHQVQKIIKQNYQENKEDIDVLGYIKSQIANQQLKNEMLRETNLKMTMCKNILSETSDISAIHKSAQMIDKSKKTIDKKMKVLLKEIPDNYFDPLLLWAGYQLIQNYSFRFFKKFSNIWRGRQMKYSRFFQEPSLINENLYEETNAFLVLAGEKHNNGQIMFCSSSIQDVCGGHKMSYNGLHVSALVTPSFQSYYSTLIKQVTETGQRELLNNKERAYLYHKGGYIVEAELFLSIHPYLTRGLYLNIFIRPLPFTQECLLVQENGDIEGATQKIGKILGINTTNSFSTTSNINMFSEELYQANRVINMVLKRQQKESGNTSMILTPETPLDTSKRKSRQEEHSYSSDYNEALELYRMYGSTGKTLEFTLLKSKKQSTYYCNCQISVINYGSAIMKVIKIQEKDRVSSSNVYTANESESLRKQRLSCSIGKGEIGLLSSSIGKVDNGILSTSIGKVENAMPSSSIGKFEHGLLLQEVEFTSRNDSPVGSENLDFFEANEKVNSDTNHDNNKPDENGLLSTSSPRHPLMTTTREKTLFTNGNRAITVKVPEMYLKRSETSHSHKVEKVIKIQKSVASSQETTNEQRIQKIFQANIATRTYPRSFKPLCIAFYLVIVAALCSQVILKAVLDTTMQDLFLKKNLLNYAQLRSYKADLIAINLYAVVSKIIDPYTYGRIATVNWNFDQIIKNANSYEPDVKGYSHKILDNLASLDDTVKQQILKKDVRINGTFVDSESKVYVNATSFDAIDTIISAMHQLTYLPVHNSTQGLELAKFVIINTLGDFLFKSEEIVDIFINSVKTQRDILQSVLTLVLVVTPLLLVGIAIMLTIIIVHQYSITKKQLLVFITLDPEKVKEIMASLNNFKRILIEESSTDGKHPFNYFFEVAFSSQASQDKGNNRKQNQSRRVEFTEIKKKYYGYFFRVIFYILILIGIMTWNSTSAQSFVDNIYWRQNQLEFANRISYLASSNYLSVLSVSFFNNSVSVKGMSPLEVSYMGLAETQKVRSQMLDVFKELDGTYDPEIRKILLEHRNCSQIKFNPSSSSIYCTILQGMGQYSDLVSLLTLHENIIYDKIQDYNVYCDRFNSSALMECTFKQYNAYLATFVLSAIQAQMIGNIVGANLELNYSGSFTQRDLLLGVFGISFFFVSLLTWFQILTKLREIHNEFKKVLQVFPPSCILGCFFIKTYLQKHAKSYLPLPYAI